MNSALPCRSQRIVSFAAGALVMVLCAGGASVRPDPVKIPRAPEPDVVPKRWEFDAEFSPLYLTAVRTADKGVQAYFFMYYEVMNHSGEDVVFAPTFDLATDEGHSIRAYRDVPNEVTKHILGRLENPLLLDQIQVLGPLLQGEENAREGLVVWAAPDLEVDEIRVFATGFSGESETLDFPDPASGSARKVTFRKTRMMTFHTPGRIVPNDAEPIRPIEAAWVMR